MAEICMADDASVAVVLVKSKGSLVSIDLQTYNAGFVGNAGVQWNWIH